MKNGYLGLGISPDRYIDAVSLETIKGVKCYKIFYADGRIDWAEYNSNNAKRLEEILTSQAKKGAEKKLTLQKKQRRGTILRSAIGLGGSVLAGGAVYTTVGDVRYVALASGVIALFGIVSAIKHYGNLQGILEDIDNSNNRLDSQNMVRGFLESSPNVYRALDGATKSQKLARAKEIFCFMSQGGDATSLLSGCTHEGLTDGESERAIEEAEREKALGLTLVGNNSYLAYQKTLNRPQ